VHVRVHERLGPGELNVEVGGIDVAVARLDNDNNNDIAVRCVPQAPKVGTGHLAHGHGGLFGDFVLGVQTCARVEW